MIKGFRFSYISNLLPGRELVTVNYDDKQVGINGMRYLGVTEYTIQPVERQEFTDEEVPF